MNPKLNYRRSKNCYLVQVDRNLQDEFSVTPLVHRYSSKTNDPLGLQEHKPEEQAGSHVRQSHVHKFGHKWPDDLKAKMSEVRRKADLREDVLLTCLISSIHRYLSSRDKRHRVQVIVHRRGLISSVTQKWAWRLQQVFEMIENAYSYDYERPSLAIKLGRRVQHRNGRQNCGNRVGDAHWCSAGAGVDEGINTAFSVLRMVQRTFSLITRMEFQIIYGTYVRPLLEYANEVFCSGRKEVTLTEHVQRAATQLVAGLKSVDYETHLFVLDLFPLEYRCLQGDLIPIYALLEQGLANSFSTFDSANTRWGHGERQSPNNKNKIDPGNLGESLDPVYQSVDP
ncbi:hypothetical protein CLF_101773 [Clonorchis sinensis]|uniref:Uncharacterized protein n=1 Tax=Clonorchis sinensis TaxID=79923 RepID=G7Y6J2_CLOSI|nr:hypothetical protein CLF_101773 [Clonorchis sinensis]